MAMGQQIGHCGEMEFAQPHDELLGIVAGINHDGLAGSWIGHKITIFF